MEEWSKEFNKKLMKETSNNTAKTGLNIDKAKFNKIFNNQNYETTKNVQKQEEWRNQKT